MTQQEGYQQPPPQPMYHQPAPKAEISDMFVGKGKLDLFILGSALMLLLGLLFLDLMRSGAADYSDALYFLGYLLVHVGIVGFISLLMVGGIVREDIPETTRNMMLRSAGLIAAAFVFAIILGFMSVPSFY